MLYAYEDRGLPERFSPNPVKVGGDGGESLRGGTRRTPRATAR